MRYCLIHCYSDNNKGDLGIILSTIKMLREHDENAVITGVSTYNYDDPWFHSEHKILRKEIDVFPAIFGVLNIGNNRNGILKILRFVYDTIRILFVIITNGSLLLLPKEEKVTFSELAKADYIISKGGSFLCNENNLRSKLGFIRLLYFFILIRFSIPNSKVIILCQSLGPVYGKISTWLFNHVLRSCKSIVLRESKCIEKYPHIKIPQNILYYSNDIAFHLQPVESSVDLFTVSDNLKVGVTIKTMEPSLNAIYRDMMKAGIEHIVRKYQAKVYIYPHVTIGDDIDASLSVYRNIDDDCKKNIVVFTDDYSSPNLKSIYSKMNFFISSRLHSAIFAMGECVPAIVIAYHGTKAQGVFSNFGYDDMVIENYDSSVLIDKIDYMCANYVRIKKELKEKLLKDKENFNILFENLFFNEIHKNF